MLQGGPPALPGREQKFDRSESLQGPISSTFIFSFKHFFSMVAIGIGIAIEIRYRL
jgi:hypothetical protein